MTGIKVLALIQILVRTDTEHPTYTLMIVKGGELLHLCSVGRDSITYPWSLVEIASMAIEVMEYRGLPKWTTFTPELEGEWRVFKLEDLDRMERVPPGVRELMLRMSSVGARSDRPLLSS